ncbi:MAG: RHS repeat-associated core domain-containing protein [Gammaproteobacteria bacterium]
MVINLECYYPNTVSPNYPGWCLTPFQTLECSPFVFDPTKGCVAPAEGKPCNKECAGDPINIGTGNTYEETTDYRGSGLFPLVFSRAYNSAFANESYSPDFASTNENMGQGWSTNTGAHLFINDYTPQILITPCIINGTEYFCPPTYFPSYTIELTVWHADGGQDQFNYQVVNNVVPTPGTPLNAEPGSAGELTFVNLPAPMMGTGYEYLRNDGYTEFYDLNGTLLVVEDPHGLTQIYAYQYTNGVLSGMTVTDPFGRTMQFTYNSNNQITTMTNPAGGVYTYSYDTNGNLIKVTYPDNSTIQYQYTNATYKNALTGVIDENGNTYATWTYDSQGRAISTLQGSNANPFSIVYNSDGSATVTEPTGEVRTLTFTSVDDTPMFSTVSAPCTQCGDKSQSITYDGNGHESSSTDFNGNVTQYSYDSAGRILSETDAYGTPVARTTSTQWDTTRNLPDLITEPGRTTTWVRNNPPSHGFPFTWSKTVTDTATQVSRTSTYNYNGAGLLTSIVGPRTDVNQTTSFTYDSSGDIATITNALGQVTQITSYDANGYPLTIVDPNGVTTTLAYDARQRLTSRTVAGAQTQFSYDAAGNLNRVTLPTGAYLQYAYDTAHRLTAINDKYGNKIAYTLDNLGNRTVENTTDPNRVLTRTLQRTYDSLNHLLTVTGGAGQVTHYTEDQNGNTTNITDPLSNPYAQGFDALNRLVSVLDPYTKTTGYTYDGLDRVTAVSDPRTLNTQYSYDGFDDVTQLTSPDTGRTTYTYDLGGNRLTQTDARRITAQYTYDALDRLTGITYPVSSLNMAFTYDQGSNGIGHLTRITDATGTTSYTYNARGDVTRKSDAVGASGGHPHTFTVSYGYDTADNLTSLTYPDGTVIAYTRDSAERIISVYRGSSAIVSSITYKPFGPVTGLTYGNGLTDTRTYDQDYRLTSITVPNILSWALGYNADDDITGLTDNLVGGNSQTLGYDNLNRLSTGSGAYGSQSYGYDANGNRNTETLNGTNTTLNIAATSNQLASLSGGQNKTYQYDANGNLISDGTNTYTYDDTNRLAGVTTSSGTDTYQYNGLGQRIEKTVGSATTVYVYDEAGHLLGEYTPSGGLIAEHIWMGNRPIGLITASGLYYVTTDQLGTPRAITNSSKTVVWQWNSDPFGNGTPTGSITYNLRMPGQYYDAETGHNYNYFRDYDPTIGRYVESDPIGLKSGINTYTYVADNPISNTDPLGLMCMPSIGCYTTPAERAAAESGNYLGYYQLACAGGDAYACFAEHVAANDSWWGNRATNRLLDKLHKEAEATQQCLNYEGILNHIRSDLAKDYAEYLPQSPNNAIWPNAWDIARFHWNEFAQFGLPANTFGGTPFGQNGPLFLPGVWCPNCRP